MNGQTIQVTTNLASALRHIRDTGVREVLDSFWADAICIDQHNLGEKTHQVQLMGSLFSKATLVLSWLGPETDNSTPALEFMHRLAEAVRKAAVDEEDGKSLDWLRAFPEVWRDVATAVKDKGYLFYALHSLNKRSFFSRGWVFQESYLAQLQVFMCGHTAISADDLQETQNFLREIGERYSKPSFIDVRTWFALASDMWGFKFDQALRSKRVSQEAPTLPDLLLRTRLLKVSEPRDKIYSLLGIVNERINVDYQRSIADLYCEVAQIWIRDLRSLEFLSFTYLHKSEKTDPDIPSWAPDWHAFTYGHPLLLGRYRHRRHRSLPRSNAEVDGRILRVSGIHVEVGKIFKNVLLDGTETIFSTFKEYLGDLGQYPTGESRMLALFHAFLNNSNGASSLEEIEKNEELYSGLHTAFVRRVSHPESVTPNGSKHCEKEIVVRGVWMSKFGTRFFHTSDGYLGFSVGAICPSDVVYAIPGGTNLTVLRKHDSHHVVVGSCWIYGFMDNEALQGKTDLEMLELR